MTRFSVSLEKSLVERFDRKVRAESCPTRSKAIGDLIRQSLIEDEWLCGADVAGAIVLVYEHHKRDLVRRLTDIQHGFHDLIISTQHIHLDQDNCLEIIAVRGSPADIHRLAKRLKAAKGVKHAALAAATTGRHLH